MIFGVPFLRNTYTILAYKKQNSDGTVPANDGSSHTDPRLGLLGLTDSATAVQQFHQDANNIPELVPLDSPLTAVELGENVSTFRATTQEALRVRIVRAPTPVQGWTESWPASPLVKLPASALRRPTLPCSSPYSPSPTPLVTHSPMVTTSLADGAGATTESSSWEDVELG
ncbi:hypothetical protein GY45DRAFT_1340603 [Cubamyces sp. BRFM 1775]|nr:hypothetical protein GY45DRAFT_1340603 [Cubamyces sp. BRFM 1775]